MTIAPDDTMLRLIALDEEDLAVISANLQDAQVTGSDFAFLPNEKRFAFVCRRFDWVQAKRGGCQWRASGVHFNQVIRVTRIGFAPSETSRVLNLLAVNFEVSDAPGGAVTLTFSGDAAIKLDVECIETQLRDLGPCLPCGPAPEHGLDPDYRENGSI